MVTKRDLKDAIIRALKLAVDARTDDAFDVILDGERCVIKKVRIRSHITDKMVVRITQTGGNVDVSYTDFGVRLVSDGPTN